MATTLAPPSIHIYTIYYICSDCQRHRLYVWPRSSKWKDKWEQVTKPIPISPIQVNYWILGNTWEARVTRMTLLRNPNLNPSAANFYTAAAVGHWGKDLFHILNREQERGSRSWWLLTLYHPNESVEICYKDIETIPGRLRNYEESEENFFWENLSWKKRGDITWEN